MSPPLPRIAVIMRSKDSAWVIDQALAGLFSQRLRAFELHVVDSGSKDATLDIVRRHPCRLETIPAGDYFPGKVLNDAIRRADADWIVFQNSDVVPLTICALERLVAPLHDPRVVATFARQVPRPEAHGWVVRDYAEAFPARGDAPPWMAWSLPFAAMKRSAWEARPFYEEAWASEDTEWGTWARGAGHRIAYVPDAVVMHSHNYTLSQMYGRRFVEGEADAFIQADAPFGIAASARAWVASVAHDSRALVARRDVGGLLASPVRRAVGHYAYLRGRWHGGRRRRAGDRDVVTGQREVLSRYG